MPKHYIVEHPTRGVLTAIEDDGRPNFSPAATRREAKAFTKVGSAKRVIEDLPADIARACHVRESENWNVIA
jgi:hypothetical protein